MQFLRQVTREIIYGEKPLLLWLSEFTYLLHGDQGMSLYSWLRMFFGRVGRRCASPNLLFNYNLID
ncbi:MAG: hypothetical protein AABY49_00370 [Planctomycetota bacterium]